VRIIGQHTCDSKERGDKVSCGKPAVGYTRDLGNDKRVYLCAQHAGEGLWVPAVTYFKDKEL
jgi:hypothetical protein